MGASVVSPWHLATTKLIGHIHNDAYQSFLEGEGEEEEDEEEEKEKKKKRKNKNGK